MIMIMGKNCKLLRTKEFAGIGLTTTGSINAHAKNFVLPKKDRLVA